MLPSVAWGSLSPEFRPLMRYAAFATLLSINDQHARMLHQAVYIPRSIRNLVHLRSFNGPSLSSMHTRTSRSACLSSISRPSYTLGTLLDRIKENTGRFTIINGATMNLVHRPPLVTQPITRCTRRIVTAFDSK